MHEFSSQESQWKSFDSILSSPLQVSKVNLYTDLTGRLFMALEIYAEFRYIFV